MKFDAEKTNRAGDAKRTLHVPDRLRGELPARRLFTAPLSDEAIARCRAKARAARPR